MNLEKDAILCLQEERIRVICRWINAAKVKYDLTKENARFCCCPSDVNPNKTVYTLEKYVSFLNIYVKVSELKILTRLV